MGASKKFVLADLSGGLNQSEDPTDIDDKELQAVRNFYPYAKRLVLRNGVTRISGEPAAYRYAEAITNASPYKVTAGDWSLIVGGLTTIGILDGSTLTDIPHVDLTTYTSNDEPWSFAQYKDVLYCAREGIGYFQRTDGEIVGDAGIDEPGTAPTIAEGAAGNLDAGDYIAVVTFINTSSGNESNPSPVSSTLTLAASKRITWTDIPTSTNFQVDGRRLYRTLVDQQGVYYLVDEIADNATTTYDDNVVETSLGIDVSFDNGLPPSGLKYIAVFQERMFGTDGVDLWYSELIAPESFAETNFIQVQPDDGHLIAGILPFGNKLIIGKTNKSYVLTGTDVFELEVLGDHGCFSHHSMKASEDFAFWFGGDNFYQTDGNTIRAIGDKKVREAVDSIDLAYAYKITAAVDRKKGWYLANVPLDGATSPNAILVYNYRDDSWSIFDYTLDDATTGGPGFIADFYSDDGTALIYCNLDGGDEDSIFQLNTGNDDDGRDIVGYFRTKSFGYDKEDVAKFMKNIGIQATVANIDLNVSLYGDGVITAMGEKTLNLAEAGLWKRVPLSNAGDPATSIALHVEATTSEALEVLGLMFKIVDLEREVPTTEFS